MPHTRIPQQWPVKLVVEIVAELLQTRRAKHVLSGRDVVKSWLPLLDSLDARRQHANANMSDEQHMQHSGSSSSFVNM